MLIILADPSTYPVVGSWAWDGKDLPRKVIRRFRESGIAYLNLDTPQGDRTLPLTQVVGWCHEYPSGQQIISDTGWPATIIGFDPKLGLYQVVGDCIIGWLYPDQFTPVENQQDLLVPRLCAIPGQHPSNNSLGFRPDMEH